MVSLIGCPVSRDSSRASSPARASMASASAVSSLPRSAAGRGGGGGGGAAGRAAPPPPGAPPPDVLRPGLGHRGEHGRVGGVDDVDAPAGQAFGQLAVDVQLRLHGQAQKSTGWVGNWPLLISWGIFGLAFSQTSSMERLGE